MSLLDLLPLYGFGMMMVLCRLGSACMLLPGLGEAELPATIRLAIALAFTALVLPVLAPEMPPPPKSPLVLACMVLAEITTGLWLGWLVRLMLFALPMAGQIIAGAVGMTNVLQQDAMLGGGASALSRLFGLAAPLLLLISGLWSAPVIAVVGLYRILPPGAALPSIDTAQAVIAALDGAFALALRLSAPFLLAGLVFHLALALIARLVPQLQTYFAAAPGQILGGMALLLLLSPLLLDIWQSEARAVLVSLPGL
jgi:flagellar biosynthetic protein FliR